jgi:hypothetical protein
LPTDFKIYVGIPHFQIQIRPTKNQIKQSCRAFALNRFFFLFLIILIHVNKTRFHHYFVKSYLQDFLTYKMNQEMTCWQCQGLPIAQECQPTKFTSIIYSHLALTLFRLTYFANTTLFCQTDVCFDSEVVIMRATMKTSFFMAL